MGNDSDPRDPEWVPGPDAYNSQAFTLDEGSWDPNIIRGKTEAPCWQCQTPTLFIEVNFEASICSPACEEDAWNEYWEANRRLGPPDTS